MKRTAVTTILDAISDKHLFRPWFRDRATWQSWFAFLAALFALPMTAEQLAIYRQCTGRTEAPTAPQRKAGWFAADVQASRSSLHYARFILPVSTTSAGIWHPVNGQRFWLWLSIVGRPVSS